MWIVLGAVAAGLIALIAILVAATRELSMLHAVNCKPLPDGCTDHMHPRCCACPGAVHQPCSPVAHTHGRYSTTVIDCLVAAPTNCSPGAAPAQGARADTAHPQPRPHVRTFGHATPSGGAVQAAPVSRWAKAHNAFTRPTHAECSVY